MSRTSKTLGVAIPVVVATSLCLSIPFMLLIADAAILAAAVFVFVSERREAALAERSLPELE